MTKMNLNLTLYLIFTIGVCLIFTFIFIIIRSLAIKKQLLSAKVFKHTFSETKFLFSIISIEYSTVSKKTYYICVFFITVGLIFSIFIYIYVDPNLFYIYLSCVFIFLFISFLVPLLNILFYYYRVDNGFFYLIMSLFYFISFIYFNGNIVYCMDDIQSKIDQLQDYHDYYVKDLRNLETNAEIDKNNLKANMGTSNQQKYYDIYKKTLEDIKLDKDNLEHFKKEIDSLKKK